MNIADIIGLVAIALVLSGAVAYIIKTKKSGKGCIGCPDSKNCSGDCTACHVHSKTNKKQ